MLCSTTYPGQLTQKRDVFSTDLERCFWYLLILEWDCYSARNWVMARAHAHTLGWYTWDFLSTFVVFLLKLKNPEVRLYSVFQVNRPACDVILASRRRFFLRLLSEPDAYSDARMLEKVVFRTDFAVNQKLLDKSTGLDQNRKEEGLTFLHAPAG